ILVCPSEMHRNDSYAFGWNSYHMNYGTWVKANGWDGVFAPNFVAITGVKGNAGVRFKEIKDGLSNTAGFAEVAFGLGADAGPTVSKDPRVDCYEGTTLDATVAGARSTLQGLDYKLAGYAGGPSYTGGGGTGAPWSWRGYPWREGSIWKGGYTH